MSAVYRIRELTKEHRSESGAFRLHVPNMTIATGEKVALVGPSGCGKSTLLDVLALAARPTKSKLFSFRPERTLMHINKRWESNDQDGLGDMRAHNIGYVLQTGGLLPYLTAGENIALSLRLLKDKNAKARVLELAQELEIVDQLKKLPAKLSAGQRQRVAIARALAHRPAIVLADEPTSSLDPVTGSKVMALFMRLVDESGVTVILSTHDWPAVKRFDLRALKFETRVAKDGIVEGVFND